MFSVTFGEITSDSLNLIGAQKVIGYPRVKTRTVAVPGSDVTLDFTEADGSIHYENRQIKLTFLSLKPWSQQMAQDSSVKKALHGRKFNIVFSDDTDFYYVGRVSVGDWEFYRGAGRVIIMIDAEPYKYKATVTTQSVTAVDDGEITLTNGRMPAVPTITADAACTLSWDDYSAEVSAGEQIIPQLVLNPGSTVVTVTGSATVSFEWTEGSL